MRRVLLAGIILLACGNEAVEALEPSAGGSVQSSPAACVPGASRACSGAGQCAGFQICSGSGQSFGPCDCGAGGAGGGATSAAGGSSGSASGGTGGEGPLDDLTLVDAGLASDGGLGAAGSSNMPVGPLFSGGVGRPCTSTASCPGAPLVCIESTSNTEFATAESPQGGGPQGGYCSLPCTSDADCIAIDDISACNTALGFCFGLCLPGAGDVKCGADRPLVCVPIVQDNSLGVCIPRCTSDAACGAGRFCDPGLLGLCMDQAPAGGKVGDACTVANETTDCASGVCLEYSDPNDPTGVLGSFCSANCTFGLSNGCGFDTVSGGLRSAGCFQAQLGGGAPGDLGYCFPLCDTTQDCAQAGDGWVCDPFDDPAAVQIVGRAGECLPTVLSNGADAGPG